jgi:hypothetical protein
MWNTPSCGDILFKNYSGVNSMSISWEQETDSLLVLRISGKLIFSEFKDNQSKIEPILHAQGKMGLLAILDDFQGWDSDEGWEDMGLLNKNDKYLSRFAIVGNEEWRDEVSLFTLIGLRPVDISYFTTEVEARKWLSDVN